MGIKNDIQLSLEASVNIVLKVHKIRGFVNIVLKVHKNSY